MWTDELDRAIDNLFPRMVALRRHLHAHPEPSGQENDTSLHLYTELSGAGFRVRIGPEGRGVLVDSPVAAGARCMALRADIDALRIQDAKLVEYRSQKPGLMHACGHDAHSATVFGAIAGLRAAAEAELLPWPVCWRAIFQPAEETARGATEMIAAGALEGVDAILGLHMDPSRAYGKVGVRMGALTAACDELEVHLEGRGGHAARPHESIDPIAAAAQLISSIYLFVPRAVASHDPVVVTIGQISGGDNSNVIPERVVLRGTIRTLNRSTRQRTKEHIEQLARGLAEASGAAITVAFQPGPPSVGNDIALTRLVQEAAGQLLGAEHVEEIPRPSMGGDDFANYLDHVPGCMFRLGCVSDVLGGAPLHSPMFDIDERSMLIGAKLLARSVVHWSAPEQ